ncbi:MAG: EAL domain-containing protein, partial [Pseudomonadota bacterium]|nr:EAL domain-containing protein [Pseudomonadota bacterium]
IEVRTRDPGRRADWIVFALRNDSDEQIERFLVAPHFRLPGSGLVWPDLEKTRLAAVTPSQGVRPERVESEDADVYSITLDPGAVVTYVVELGSQRLPQLYLWEPDAYKDKTSALSLYHGIALGIAGLLAVFLTIIFVVRGAAMFPAAAGLAWAVLAYLVVDFGFWRKLFGGDAAAASMARASVEVLLSATVLIFLVAYLNLYRWHMRLSLLAGLWVVGLFALFGLALYDPAVASGVARLSLAGVGVVGFAVVLYLALQHFERAVMLIPTWFLYLLWLGAAALAVTGRLANDLVAPALAGGLVLIVLLIGFTVMQHAFAGAALAHGLISDAERKALAMAGSGDMVWDWDVTRDHIHVADDAERTLGVKRGTLEGEARRWLALLHPQDRDRFRAALDGVVEKRRGRVAQDLRLKTHDGHYAWFRLKARPIVGSDGEVVRCVGTMADVTEAKIAEERLLHDAVHDNLTGLPNRELFLDRLEAAMTRAKLEQVTPPTVLVLDMDRFKQVNDSVGFAVGDSVLLTLARRLARLLKPQDTLARLSGDQFGVILLSEAQGERVSALAETLRRTVRAPISFNEREIVLTASIGLAAMEARHRRAEELVTDAETAMRHAKRLGMDRVESFKPTMRGKGPDRLSLEADLRRAIERDEVRVLYQPIVRLADKRVGGFEALLRWDHPKLGRLAPADFIALAEDCGAIVDLGLFVLDRAARQAADWRKDGDAGHPFVSVNLSSRQLLRQDLVNDIKTTLTRTGLDHGALKLEITESLVMENPELATQVLTRVRDLGTGLSLDDFGTGHSSLAYLQRFPFDTVKVDRSFVRPNGKAARPIILRSIVSLAHDLGMEVVAEGAETPADADALRELGCEYVQGFAFGGPMPPEQALKLLLAQARATRH